MTYRTTQTDADRIGKRFLSYIIVIRILKGSPLSILIATFFHYCWKPLENLGGS
jgi:hypothetical protein